MAGTTVIVGAGHAGVQVAASLRQRGYDGRVILIADESEAPYHRPPLSKHMRNGLPGDPLPLRALGFYDQQAVELLRGTRVTAIDPARHAVTTANGAAIGYDRLVLATGSRPRRLDIPGAQLGGVHVLRTHEDASRIAADLDGCVAPAAIGAGMIGLEFAAVAAATGKAVTVIEATTRLLGRAASSTMANILRAEHEHHGVTLVMGETVARLEGEGRVQRLVTNRGRTIDCDLALLAVGAIANAELAVAAGLEVAGGIVVDSQLCTSDPDIFAVGDCAVFPTQPHGPMVRLESVQNATDQARHVAGAIMGDTQPYNAVPWFWSDQYGFKLQIAGITSAADFTRIVGDPATGRFSVFCFERDALVGVETVNQPREHMAARRLLASGQSLIVDELTRPGFSLIEREKLTNPQPAGAQAMKETT